MPDNEAHPFLSDSVRNEFHIRMTNTAMQVDRLAKDFLAVRGPVPSYHALKRALDGIPFNNLTPAQAELLDVLAEECAEIIQVVSKIKRHGYESRWPQDKGATNREELQREMGHANAISYLLERAGEIDRDRIQMDAAGKLDSIQRWLHHNKVPPPRKPEPFNLPLARD